MKNIHLFFLATMPLVFAACGGDKTAAEAPAESEAAPREIAGPTIVLTTEIPSEVIEGTPMPIQVANLEQAPNSAPSLQVPEGTRLLSLGKPVTASDGFSLIGDLNFLTDGEKQGGEGYFVELMDGLQWVQIDLEAPAAVQAIWLWHFHSQARAYHDVIVQVSNDPEFKEGVTTLFNNDYDDSAGLGRGSDRPYIESRFGKLIDGRGTSAQYIRLYSKGNTSNDLNHYIEVEVWGQ